ncbi:MAG: tetratricopeptide repeat protein, partial [Anaerolineae bacterium]
YQQALRFRTPDAAPLQYATTQNNLGIAYSDLPTGDRDAQDERAANLQRAIDCYEKALHIPNLPLWEKARYLRNFGDAYRAAENYDAAMDTYRQALALEPDNANAWYSVASIAHGQNEWETAKEAYLKVIELAPDYAWSYHNLGRIHARFGDYDEAIKLYREAIERHESDENRALSWSRIADAYRRQGQIQDATAAYQRTLSLNPDSASDRTMLGSLYELQGQLEDALHEHQRAVELDPDTGMRHASLSSVLRKLGRNAEAAEHLARARELVPEDDDYNLTCLEAIAGNVDVALDHLEKAIAWDATLRDWAARDPDLEPLRGNPRFEAMVRDKATNERMSE